MKTIAIKGHPTREKEVIEILEMFGGENKQEHCGNNPNVVYYISHENTIVCDWERDGYTIEEFLEKYPYKVGDKVQHSRGIGIITSMHWDDMNSEVQYNVCVNNETWLTSVIFLKHCKEQETMEEKKAIPPYMDYDVRTEKDMEEKLLNAETYFKIWNKTDNGYEVVVNDNYELKQIDNHFYIKKKQPQYPKTYEECCKVLFPNSIAMGKVLTSGYNCELLKKFGELLICRDAYWKIAGEQMGLGKSWKPNWSNDLSKYYISFYNNKVDKGVISYSNKILAFPTEEMLDTFFDNFKELIEQCKELL